MEFYNDFTGAAPARYEFQVTATLATAGIPVVGGAEAEAGVTAASENAAVDVVGITLDTATYVTAQQSDNSDPAATVTVIVNPMGIYTALLSGGTSSNTALALGTEDTGSATGLLVSTDVDYSSPNMAGGSLWGYSGANAGVLRKVPALSTADAVPDVAFPHDIAVGDTFIVVPFSPGTTNQFVHLTGTFEQVNAAVTVDNDNDNFRPLQIVHRDAGDSGTTNSFVRLTICDSMWTSAGA